MMKNNSKSKTGMIYLNKFLLSIVPLILLSYSPVNFSSESVEGMNKMDNLQIVKGIYKGFETGDMEAILKNMSENIVWLHPGNPEQIPFAGKFEGEAGVQRFFDTAFAQIDVLEQKIYSFEGSGDKVLVVGFEHMRVKNTGKEYQSNWIHMYTLAHGKVITFEEFIDTAALVSAFALK